MLIPNHPSDERLSALASADADATGDTELGSHVDACARCTETVTELGALRASLADLPDLRPSRPLRLLPEAVEEPSPATDRLAGWVRRVFAPVLTAGAALAMVGLVGTAVPLAGSGDSAGGEAEAQIEVAESAGSGIGGENAPLASDRVAAPGAEDDGADGDTFGLQSAGADTRQDAETDEGAFGIPAERSPWPMVLFSGLALVVGALLLRWIVVPRAG